MCFSNYYANTHFRRSTVHGPFTAAISRQFSFVSFEGTSVANGQMSKVISSSVPLSVCLQESGSVARNGSTRNYCIQVTFIRNRITFLYIRCDVIKLRERLRLCK